MLKIDKEIIDSTHGHCPKWEVCVTGDLQYCCKVTEYDCEHLIVEPTEKSTAKYCPRSVSIDSTHICLCPLRKEIYRKYEI